jgi:hypothetical protein
MKAMNPATSDPKEAIFNRLSLYGSRSYPCVPNVTTVLFLAEWLHPKYQVHRVTFQDRTGQPWYFTCVLKLREDGLWKMKGAAGGYELSEPPSLQDWPCIRLSGGWTGSGQTRTPGRKMPTSDFFAYGQVFDENLDIARVCLVSPNGMILEDTVKDSHVFFWTDQAIVLPLQAELYTRSNELVRTQPVFKIP